MTYDATETAFDYAGTRIRIQTNALFDVVTSAFETAVPELSDEQALEDLGRGDWAEFLRGLEWESPSGFVRVATLRPDTVMSRAGSSARSVMWMITHYGIAPRLFRHDPGSVLYAPLRIEAHTSKQPGTTLSFDIPSAQLRGFGINKITQAGAELDRALGDLIEDIGLPRPAALRR